MALKRLVKEKNKTKKNKQHLKKQQLRIKLPGITYSKIHVHMPHDVSEGGAN